MKISIITPSYNSAKTISRTVESVIAQDYPDLEYIIIDGASSDNTRDIVAVYQNKINIKFISEPDKGIYDAMNKGVKLATGDIVGILNSDDFYENNYVLKMVSGAFGDEKVDAVYGDINYFSEDVNKVSRYWHSGEYKENKLDSGWIMPHPSLFLRKSVYEKCSYFNLNFKIAADYEFMLRILKIYKIHTRYIPSVFVRMYDGGTSGSSLKQRMRGWQELRNSWEINHLKVPLFFTTRRVLSKVSQFLLK